MTLFVRTGRRIQLTLEGKMLAGEVRAALAQINKAVEAVSPSEREHRLTVRTLPSFAGRWLMPRIRDFLSIHPQ